MDYKGTGRCIGCQGETEFFVKVKANNGQIALQIGLLIDGLERVARADALENGRTGIVGGMEDFAGFFAIFLDEKVKGIGRKRPQGSYGIGLGVSHEIVTPKPGGLLDIVGYGQAIYLDTGWFQDAVEAGDACLQTAVANFLDGTEGTDYLYPCFSAAFSRARPLAWPPRYSLAPI